MLAANIWHWWIGVVITLLIMGGLVIMIASYLKFVTSQKYEPGSSRKSRRQSSDL